VQDDGKYVHTIVSRVMKMAVMDFGPMKNSRFIQHDSTFTIYIFENSTHLKKTTFSFIQFLTCSYLW